MSAKPYEEIKYCLRCAFPLELQEKFGAIRPTCPACGWVYFADPKVAVAALVEDNGLVLLVRRVNDPQKGFWTLPAGFIDAGEDPQLALIRECQEETGLQVRITSLVDVIAGQEHPRGANILIVYRASVTGGELQAADDVDMAAYFSPDSLPPLAFSTTRRILAQWSLGTPHLLD